MSRPGQVAVDEPALAAWLRPLVYLCSTFVFAFPLATPGVALAVALGACAGAVVGRVLAGSRLRLLALGLASAALLGSIGVARGALLQSEVLAGWLGPARALGLTNALSLGAGAACVAGFVRALALRRRLYRALEVAFVGVAFAQLVAAHRGGAINRPFELADSIIAAGRDPTLALLAVGAVAAVASVLLLLSERSPLRFAAHLLVALLLLALVLGTTRMLGLPHVDAGSSALGLRPKQSDEHKQGQPHGGKGNGSNDNEQLEFRDNYEESGRQVPLAVVLLHDDYSPPSGIYYFRQAAFSQYNGRRLIRATRSDVDNDIAPGFVGARTALAPVPNDHGDRIELETTVAMLADHNRPFALESAFELSPAKNPDPGRFRRAYTVLSLAFNADYESLLGRGVGDPSWSPEQRMHYEQPANDPRYAQLAQQIVASIPEHVRDDKLAQAAAIALFLGHEGIYSLRSGHSEAADPTADFLFGDRTGYCVHFAHAAVYLMRALGIPARVGSGYAVDEAARQGGSAILLAGANSHAWPEVYVRGTGWVVLDVHPERSLDKAVAPPDPDLQRLLGEMARGDKPLPQGEQLPLEPIIANLRALFVLLGVLGFALLRGTLLLAYGIKYWRRLAPALASPLAAPRVAYRAELDRLSAVGLRRRFGESREAFAARMSDQAPSFAALTEHHVGARFGTRKDADRGLLAALSAAIGAELGRAVPAWRRVLGALNPVSWLGSR
ncbi:MAG: transglutaminase family protein [Polyangiales bacterium]